MITSDIQIRYSDIDTNLHVNNINLQYFYDIGKHDYFKEVVGIGGVWDKVGIAAVNTNSNYYKTTKYEDNIVVTTCVRKLGNKSITMYQEILERDTNIKKSDSVSILVSLDIATQSGVEIPTHWREAISKYEGF